MHSYRVPVWKQIPFLRLLIPLVAGILLQWYFHFPVPSLVSLILISLLLLAASSRFNLLFRYRYRLVEGALVAILICTLAMFLVHRHQQPYRSNWYGNVLGQGSRLLLVVDEVPVRKTNSYKAVAKVKAVVKDSSVILSSGKILLYFPLSDSLIIPGYGQCIITNSPVQPIQNSGNPGAFDYQRYAAFQGIFHQIFMKQGSWVPVEWEPYMDLQHYVLQMKEFTLQALRKFISKDKKILGIAEALLIGYKDDLDKELVQAYSNTGVVHIIAISGLHLGLIYIALLWLFEKIRFLRKMPLLNAVLIISCLWLFSLLTGASASVLRSAVMFTCIVAGKAFNKQASVFNSLAASAFILLCYNPWFLWDVGFQLSYLAVLGILLVQQPLYRLLFIPNKWLQYIWQMLSVTIAAQLMAFPICLFYFHQFPNLFFISNLLAVPLSTIILFAEILLLILCPLPFLANYAGVICSYLLSWMNAMIVWMNALPFSVTDFIYADVFTTIILYFFIFLLLAGWLLQKKQYFYSAVFMAWLFTAIHVYYELRVIHRKEMIVYQVPKFRAIDFVSGQRYFFIGDDTLRQQQQLPNFHLKPARIYRKASREWAPFNGWQQQGMYINFYGKKIVLINHAVQYKYQPDHFFADVMILSNNAAVDIGHLNNIFHPAIIVMDASNSLWKIAEWKKACDALHLPCFSVPDQGAFRYKVQ